MSFIEKCEAELSKCGGRAFLVPSCTSALELSVLLSVAPGDEVILPSFTFSSCANAVIRAGAIPVFVDIRLDTLNIDANLIADAITEKTRAIMPVHYAGVSSGDWSCQKLKIIEDAAQCVGDFRLTGDFACMSFHRSKNVGCGEGGAWFVRPEYEERAQVLRNCGTTAFREKDWDWIDFGTHALIGEQTAEVLWQSLRNVVDINARRRRIWNLYRDGIQAKEKASQPGNGHIFWFLAENRDRIMRNLNDKGIRVVKHYTPLHSRATGIRYGRGNCPNATYVSERILRPPMNVSEAEAYRIIDEINTELI